jgi:hypothetical protein
MRLVLLVRVSGRWMVICTRTEDVGEIRTPLACRYSRVVTVESAREDYGVRIP